MTDTASGYDFSPIVYQPKNQNKNALVMTIAFLVGGVGAFVSSYFIPAYQALIQISAVIMLVISILVAYKFFFSHHTYSIVGKDGRLYFLIETRVGKRSTLVCQIPLSRILRIGNEKELRSADGNYFTYVASVNAPAYQVIEARGDKKPIYVKIEADAAFMEALQEKTAAVKAEDEAKRAHLETPVEEDPDIQA